MPPTADSALYRAMNPNSWWWTPEFDFHAAILNTMQMANWQRGHGKGSKPNPVKRPKDRSQIARQRDPKNGSDLTARKQQMEDELARRRELRERAVS